MSKWQISDNITRNYFEAAYKKQQDEERRQVNHQYFARIPFGLHVVWGTNAKSYGDTIDWGHMTAGTGVDLENGGKDTDKSRILF